MKPFELLLLRNSSLLIRLERNFEILQVWWRIWENLLKKISTSGVLFENRRLLTHHYPCLPFESIVVFLLLMNGVHVLSRSGNTDPLKAAHLHPHLLPVIIFNRMYRDWIKNNWMIIFWSKEYLGHIILLPWKLFPLPLVAFGLKTFLASKRGHQPFSETSNLLSTQGLKETKNHRI